MRREEEEKERTKRKRKEERDKSKVCREEKSREERKTQTKRGRGKRREKLAEGREETEEEESVFFGPLLGFFSPFYLAVRLVWPKIRIDFFLPFTWASEKIGPWLAVHYLFSLILGSSAMSAHSCGQILCFLLLGPPICWQNWKSLFCFHALGPSILSLQHSFTKSYGSAGYALVLFTILG